MIIILANRWDQTPRLVASRWTPCKVGVLTSKDLSVAGWRQRSGAKEDSISVMERKLVPQKEITGVLTLLPCVFEHELVDIVHRDRSYVAAEMTAFLLFWLARLKCPVLNRPTASCLSGPYWRREQWVRLAAQAGIPVRLVRRHTTSNVLVNEKQNVPVANTMTVVGDCVFGTGDPTLQRHALCLARLAAVELLAVHFTSPAPEAQFVSADVFPDLSDDTISGAVLEYLQRRQ
jgi:hypothetical protein